MNQFEDMQKCFRYSLNLTSMIDHREHPEVYKPIDEDEDDYESDPATMKEPVEQDESDQRHESQSHEVYSAAELKEEKDGKADNKEKDN
jgi:hypothetical protein